jgi:MFS family permease
MNDEARAARVFDADRRGLTVGILLTVTSFAVEGMGVVPALPTAVRDLGGLPLFGWAFSAFMLAWLVGTVGGGLVADARGPYRAMALGLVGFATGLFLAGLARQMMLFLGGRALQGAGGGAMIAAAYVAIARAYPDTLRPRMMALTSSVWVVPAVVGPVVSGAVAERVGWRFVFLGIVPLMAVVALVILPPLARFAVKRSLSGAAKMGSALRVAAGSGLILAAPSLYAHARAEPTSQVELATQPALEASTFAYAAEGMVAVAVVIGALLLVPGLRALLPPGTFRASRGLPAGLAVRGLVAFSFFGTEAFVPLGSGELRGVSPTQAGLALTAGAVGWVSAAWLQDRLEARRGAAGRPAVVGAGFLVLAAGIAIVSAVLLTSLPVTLVPLGWVVAGAGIGLSFNAGGLVCIAAARKGEEGQVAAQLQLAEALSTAAGTGFGGALMASLLRSGGSPRQAHGAVFAVTFAAALFGALVAGRLASAPAPNG